MATKAELEELIKQLESDIAVLQSENNELKTSIRKQIDTRRVHNCINCGQYQEAIVEDGDTFYCPVCKHTWTILEEAAPFRNKK